MEKESLKRYIIFLAALILCAGVAWYFSNDLEDPQDNAVLAGSRNLIIDLGTAGRGQLEETESETGKETWGVTETGKTLGSSGLDEENFEGAGSDIRDKTIKDETEIK